MNEGVCLEINGIIAANLCSLQLLAQILKLFLIAAAQCGAICVYNRLSCKPDIKSPVVRVIRQSFRHQQQQ